MSGQLNLQAREHRFRADGTMARWLRERPERQARASNLTVVSSDSQGMLELFAPIRSASGQPITDKTATLVATVVACLSRLAGAIVQLPIHQYSLSRAGDRERLEPDPLWWLLNEQPCAAWTSASWKNWIVRCIGLRGDQVTEILRDKRGSQGGRITGFRPLHPDWVTWGQEDVDGETRLRYQVHDPIAGRTYGLDQDDVLHFPGFGFDGCRSLSLIQWAARQAVGNSLAASEYTGKTIGEGAMPQIALSYPNKMDPKQKDFLRESFVATYTGAEARKLPLVLTEGGKAEVLSIKPVDMQLLELRKLEREDICSAAGVPPILVGINEKASAWGTGIEQITLGFVRYTIKPMLRGWHEEFNRKLYRRAGKFLEFDLDELLAGDSKAQAEFFRAALGGPGSGDGWMTVDEVRKGKNMRPLGGDAAKPFRAQRGTTAPAPKKDDDTAPPKTGDDEET